MTAGAPLSETASAHGTVLGIDVGGSGSRIAVAPADAGPREELVGPRVRVGSGGSDVPQVVRDLIGRAAEAWPRQLDRVRGIGLGATGLASLVNDPAALVALAAGEAGSPTVPAVAAIDAVTAHLGALAGEGGAVVALGTGAIAIGHPGTDHGRGCPPSWHRVDGWGHLLGDRGGGAWLGRRALEEALCAHDGVDPAGAGLLDAGRERFGEPGTWPAQLYTRPDRAGVLAGFATDVVELAGAGDAAARRLLAEAGREAARSALAALSTHHPAQVVLTGGLARAGGTLSTGFTDEIAARGGGVSVRRAVGDPLDGALALARLAAAGRVEPQEGFVWT
ncbi:BadF/BadG/BcrA/BcrD ATPase family protein [Nocardiopsis ganjiahuensis]|uniref:BadF/BadG/BcrA/BcrD ATPase family protein n=1 Tax=Nocardiopsis ganjiahuensis TaxID=239984 RepID=UPI00034776D5|nr:BadF/BadG/BcrA/BcrD ATPase family protein [Nocardiopsis ganjiahuensis]